MKYTIGLDIGIASIGFAILHLDENDNPDKIIFLDSVAFPKAEDEYGKSFAKARGISRRNRRTLRRSKFKKYQVKSLFLKSNLLSRNDIKNVFNQKGSASIYDLRSKGINQKLSNIELFRVLYNLVAHRGFKSTRKYTNKDKDIGAMKASIQDTKFKLQQSNYRTLGELLDQSNEYQDHKRNKNYDNGYLISASRSMIFDEAKQILNTQIKLNNHINQSFKNKYLNILKSQRNFDEGPGKNSRYAGNQIEKLVGNDTLDPSQPRAAKATMTFTHFKILSNLNQLAYKNEQGDDWHFLDADQKQLLSQKALNTKRLTYNQVKKVIQVPKSVYFNLVNYENKKGDSQHFSDLEDIQSIQSLLPSKFNMTHYVDAVGKCLTLYKSDKGRIKHLSNIGLSKDEIEPLLNLNFKQFGKLSINTMRNLIPSLRQGYSYDEACAKAGYDFQNVLVDKKYIQNNVTNPVVKRSVMKTIKVVNRIIKRYGKPYSIHIELARETGKSYAERRVDEKWQEDNRNYNEGIANELKELGFQVNGKTITKLKLIKAQHYMDPYTKNSDIDVTRALTSDNFYQVDHIFPYSLSFDDSLNNKVITTAKANQQKGNRLPMEYLSGDEEGIQWLKQVAGIIKNHKKQSLLLKSHITNDDITKWKQRNIKDTQYINRLLQNYFRQNIDFAEEGKKQRVFSVSGQMTAKMRSRWGIIKNREASDIHHAIDAVVIASINTSLIQKITKYSHYHEISHNSEIWKPKDKKLIREYQNNHTMQKFFNDFPLPWTDFRDEIRARTSDNPKAMMENKSWAKYSKEEIKNLKPIIVIRTPRKKINGQIHNETLRSPKLLSKGKMMYRTDVTNLTLDKDNNIKANGNAYYQVHRDGGNQHLAEQLQQVLIQKQQLETELKPLKKARDKVSERKKRNLNGRINDLFPKGFFQFEVNGKKHQVKKVKVAQNATTGVTMNHQRAFATNARFSMIRLDIFNTGKKYIMIPIYRSQIKQKKLPNTYRINKKQYQLKDNDQFMFSIHRDDLIGLITKNTSKRPSRKILGYFVKAGVSSNNITLQSPGNSKRYNIGISSLKSFKKYNINYFGEINEVHEKHRKEFK